MERDINQIRSIEERSRATAALAGKEKDDPLGPGARPFGRAAFERRTEDDERKRSRTQSPRYEAQWDCWRNLMKWFPLRVEDVVASWKHVPPTGKAVMSRLSCVISEDALIDELARLSGRSRLSVKWHLEADMIIPAGLLCAVLRLNFADTEWHKPVQIIHSSMAERNGPDSPREVDPSFLTAVLKTGLEREPKS